MKQTIKLKLIILFFFYLLFSINKINAQLTYCMTPSSQDLPSSGGAVQEGDIYLRIHVHVIRDWDGSGGQTAQQVKEAIRHLDRAFNPIGIYFVWDCTIHPIKDATLFTTIGGSMNSMPTLPNGINIYLFPQHPSPNASGNGSANTQANFPAFFATQMYVAGNFHLSPNQNLTTSHVISHEMGHCLGLRHTFQGVQIINDPECIPGEFFTSSGDGVCDTPADPGMNYNVDPLDCTWIDPDPSLGFNPDERNYMGYTHLNCLEQDINGEGGGLFTDGQEKKIRETIAAQPLLQACIVEIPPYDYVNHTIQNQNSVIGAGDYLVQGDLIIESGVTLTINSDAILTFEENAKLIVKQNARLNLYGTLTAGCRNTWEGVEVWSDQSFDNPKSQNYYYDFNTNTFFSYQGRFHGFQGALIENANIGVKLYEPQEPGDTPKGGGIIDISGMTFRNNYIGIKTAFYENFFTHPFDPEIVGPIRPYLGVVSQCTFETNDFYPKEDAFIFIDLKSVEDFQILGCTFNNTQVIDNCSNIDKYGTGIFSRDAGFILDAQCLSYNGNTPTSECIEWQRSSFYGLGYGVQMNNTISSEQSKLNTIKQADFEDCFVGVRNVGSHFPTILHNTFTMGNIPNTKCLDTEMEIIDTQLGVYLDGTFIGIAMEENHFTDVIDGDDLKTVGTYAFNTSSFDNEIRRNTFDGLDIGNKAVLYNGDGTGLHYECNTHTSTKQYDFYVMDDPVNFPNPTIRTIQGNYDEFLFQQFAAGNKFSDTGVPDESDFRNEGANQIIYYHNNLSQEIPDDAINLTYLLGDQNTCPVRYCLFPCLMPPDNTSLFQRKQNFYDRKYEYLLAKSDYETAQDAGDESTQSQKLLDMNRARQGMNKHFQKILPIMMRDTQMYNHDSIRLWWDHLDSYSADLALASDYMSTNEIGEALAILNAAPNNYNLSNDEILDLNNIIYMYTLIGQKTIYGLEKEDYDNLRIIAENYTNRAARIAKSVLELNDQVHYPPIYFKSSNENKRIGGTNENQKRKFEFKVQPNPANDYIEFTWNHLPPSPHVKLYNNIGIIVWEGDISIENGTFYLSTDFLQSGIYYYQLFNGRKITNAQPGKLIIQKH